MSEKEESRSIEEAFQALDLMVKHLESPEITLEESFQIYEQGMELLKYCNSKIDQVEKKMLKVNENGVFSEF